MAPRQNCLMKSSTESQIVAVLDVGTTNIKLLLFDKELKMHEVWQQTIATNQPQIGWREQDPEEIFLICKSLLQKALESWELAGFGITNQRETVVAWDKTNGQVLYPAILWQDQRTKNYCDQLSNQGHEPLIRQKTGLFLTPYSSASKINWLLRQDTIKNTQQLAIGTLDSWLAYKFCNTFVTDFTNASRTMLFDIQNKSWDQELLKLFDVKLEYLPKVIPSASRVGVTKRGIFSKELELFALIGDQQASLYGAGLTQGTAKITYGTGIFVMQIIGPTFELIDHFMTTLAVGEKSRPIYALEAKITDNAAARVSPLLNAHKDISPVMLSLAQETQPLLSELFRHYPTKNVVVDGGISQNDFILQTQANLNQVTITRQKIHNGTALGTAKLIFDNFAL